MLISEAYREEQQQLHKNPNYGTASIEYAPLVSQLINRLNITDLLDYGAGKGNLAKHLSPNHEIEVHHYEPADPEWNVKPDSAQLVCCIDVLEHIEPEYLDNVLDDLKRCVELFGFFSIHCGPAVKTLSDGRNAHLIQQQQDWWLPKIMERFELLTFQVQKNGFYVIVRPYQNGN